MKSRAFARTAIAAVAALIGFAFIAYGAGWHRRAVVIPQEAGEEPPPEFAAEPAISFFSAPMTAPAESVSPQIKMSFKTEPEMMLEATRGGLAVGEDGRLRLTYSGGAPPARCPT